MIHKMFTVFDSKADAYLQPFYMQTKGTAVRSFSESCNDPSTSFNKYPEDFTLFALGEYDDLHCTFDLLLTPEPIGKAIEFITPKAS